DRAGERLVLDQIIPGAATVSLRRVPSGSRKVRSGGMRRPLAFEPLENRLLLDGDGASMPLTIKWTFGDTQNMLYVLKSFSPQDANVGPLGALDPALNLLIGARYRATIESYPHHPLELIAGGMRPFDDIVLLAQTSKDDEPLSQTARWEADPGVDWVNDTVAKSVSFTLTPALAA